MFECRFLTRLVEKSGKLKGYRVEIWDGYSVKRTIATRADLQKLSKSARIVNATITSDSRVVGNIPTEVYKDIITLYHGSRVQSFTPTYGLGENKHDFGKGFYLTPSIELASEWSCCSDVKANYGYVHEYRLDKTELSFHNFENDHPLTWLCELLKHRRASHSEDYKSTSKLLIENFSVPSDDYDLLIGWRADASYFSIAKRFVMGTLSLSLIEELMMLEELGIQVVLKSKKAYSCIQEVAVHRVSYNVYNKRYNDRDSRARSEMSKVMNSDRNTRGDRVNNILDNIDYYRKVIMGGIVQ